MADKPNNGGDFEIVDPKTIQFAKRGRKSEAPEELIAKLRTVKPGETMILKAMAVDMTASDYKTVKSRMSSRIRSACKAVGIESFDIKWTVDGVPTLWF